MSGSSSPTSEHSLTTVDDRALLLPSTSSAADGDAPVAAAAADAAVAKAEDAQATPRLAKAGSEVYTITDDSLPSHMRSLLPSHEKHVHDLLTLERTRQRLRYVILALTAMLALTVVVAVALVLSLKVTPPGPGSMAAGHFRSPSFPASGEEGTEMATEVEVSLLEDKADPHHPDPGARYTHTGLKERRTPCVTECWSYAAFRFRSVCQDGFCRCHGDNYNPYTCLPKYDKCSIEKRLPSQSTAKLWGKNQTTYLCHVPARDAHSAHVISIFGNHRAATTHVTVRSQSPPSSKVLVLVNYHFVQWTVHLPADSGISKVVLVSMKRSNQAKRVIFLGPSQAPEAEVAHRLSLTGYGEDKHGGHTPQLLRFVEQQIGPVASFLGASHADDIIIDLDDPATMTTSTTMTSTV